MSCVAVNFDKVWANLCLQMMFSSGKFWYVHLMVSVQRLGLRTMSSIYKEQPADPEAILFLGMGGRGETLMLR